MSNLDEPDFVVGDYVTRDGPDVHFVKECDGYMGTFVCVVPSPYGWGVVGGAERNLCRRYSKVEYTPPYSESGPAPGAPSSGFAG